jgi:Transposase DDE domain
VPACHARQREVDEQSGREPEDEDRSGKRGRPFKRPFGQPKDQAQENFTDPDRRILKRGSSGFEQCYNAQIAIDEQAQIIVAVGVTQSASDAKELIPLLDQIHETTGESPAKGLADAGYRSESNFQELEERGVEGFVASGRERDGPTQDPNPEDEASCRMAKRMRSRRGQKHSRQRKYLGEPPFAWIKFVIGFDRFHLRGHDKVRGEWDLATLAANLRRMHPRMCWTGRRRADPDRHRGLPWESGDDSQASRPENPTQPGSKTVARALLPSQVRSAAQTPRSGRPRP